jgi:hypothetical protein
VAIIKEFGLGFIEQGCCNFRSVAELVEVCHHKHQNLMAKLNYYYLLQMEALYHRETYSIVLIRDLMELLFV